MPTVGSVGVGVVVALLVAVAGRARAEDVDAIMKRGTDLRRQGRDQEALVEFRRAAAIEETPRVLAQIGLAEQALGIWVDAEAHLGKALAAADNPWIRKNRTILGDALEVIKAHVGTVEVWGSPDGAEVVIDGRTVGHLPSVDSVRVAAEEVSLEVRAPGHATVTRTLHVKLGGLVRERVELRTLPPPAPAPVAAAGAAEAPEPEAATRATRAAPRTPANRDADAGADLGAAASGSAPARPLPPPLALEAGVGPRIVSRDLSWSKDVYNNLDKFSQSRTAIGFQLAWYPAAHFTASWPVALGLAASGEYLPDGAATIGGNQYSTTASDYWACLRLRFPSRFVDPMLSGGLGQHAFQVRDGPTASRADLALPDVRYTYLRLAADVRVRLPANVSLLAGFGYRAVSDGGTNGYEVQSSMYFERLTVTALEASGAVAYRFLGMFEARLGFDLRRYGLDMHPRSTDLPFLVSGALDQYLSFWLNVAVLVDGVQSGS
jgi:hypothetical protein